MRALVLGATGFIGGNLVRALLESGHAVRAFRRRPGPSLALAGLGTERLEEAVGDVRDRGAVESALAGCDVLYHVAGYYAETGLDLPGALREGVASVRPVLEAARRVGVPRVVYTSSLSTVGRPNEPGRLANESDYYVPGSSGHPYTEAKYAMEQEVYRYIAWGLPAIVICPTAVFGPGDVKPTSGIATLAIARSALPFYIEGQINVVDVREVALGQVAAAERARLGEKYLIGGWNVRVSDLMRVVAEAAGVAPPRRRVPGWLASALAVAGEEAGQLVPGNPAKFLTNGVQQIRSGQYLDCSKAERELGVGRRPLAETFRDSLSWFREHGYLDRQRQG